MNILITGTSTGIGAALAQHYLQLGTPGFWHQPKKRILPWQSTEPIPIKSLI
jgi:hypothetical protein